MITIQRDTWASAEHDVRSLIDAYWEEVRGESQPDALDLDSSMYEQLEALGTLVVVTVRDGGKVVGFTGWTIIAHHHYQQALTGVVDSWYLDPAYRKGRLGIQLFQKALALLKEKGCEHAVATTSTAKNVSKLLERVLKFEPIEIMYGKRL